MVQLTLPQTGDAPSLEAVISSTSSRWARGLGPGRYLDVATQATRARFAEWGPRPLEPGDERRVSAYFAAVARRYLGQRGEEGTLEPRQRLLMITVESDLLQAGWSGARAAEEARRVAGLAAGRVSAA